METRAHYVAVGAFVLAIVTLAFIAVLWLARAQLTTQYALYDIYFTGAVSGLREGGAVEYNGVPVGRVAEVRISPDNVERIRVTIEIETTVVIKQDAAASVESNLLSGVSFIQIVGGTQDAPILTAQTGQRYPIIRSHRSRLASISARAAQLRPADAGGCRRSDQRSPPIHLGAEPPGGGDRARPEPGAVRRPPRRVPPAMTRLSGRPRRWGVALVAVLCGSCGILAEAP